MNELNNTYRSKKNNGYYLWTPPNRAGVGVTNNNNNNTGTTSRVGGGKATSATGATMAAAAAAVATSTATITSSNITTPEVVVNDIQLPASLRNNTIQRGGSSSKIPQQKQSISNSNVATTTITAKAATSATTTITRTNITGKSSSSSSKRCSSPIPRMFSTASSSSAPTIGQQQQRQQQHSYQLLSALSSSSSSISCSSTTTTTATITTTARRCHQGLPPQPPPPSSSSSVVVVDTLPLTLPYNTSNISHQTVSDAFLRDEASNAGIYSCCPYHTVESAVDIILTTTTTKTIIQVDEQHALRMMVAAAATPFTTTNTTATSPPPALPAQPLQDYGQYRQQTYHQQHHCPRPYIQGLIQGAAAAAAASTTIQHHQQSFNLFQQQHQQIQQFHHHHHHHHHHNFRHQHQQLHQLFQEQRHHQLLQQYYQYQLQQQAKFMHAGVKEVITNDSSSSGVNDDHSQPKQHHHHRYDVDNDSVFEMSAADLEEMTFQITNKNEASGSGGGDTLVDNNNISTGDNGDSDLSNLSVSWRSFAAQFEQKMQEKRKKDYWFEVVDGGGGSTSESIDDTVTIEENNDEPPTYESLSYDNDTEEEEDDEEEDGDGDGDAYADYTDIDEQDIGNTLVITEVDDQGRPLSKPQQHKQKRNHNQHHHNRPLRSHSTIRLPQREVRVDILLPNGTMQTMNLALDCTFAEIKEETFELAALKGPMYGALKDAKSYHFTYIDMESSCHKAVDDEDIRLCDAAPFGGLLTLQEHQEDMAALELDEQIGRLIGKPLKDFEALRNPEVNDFRNRMKTLCEQIVKQRQVNSWLDKMCYAFPCSVDLQCGEEGTELPQYLRACVHDEQGRIPVKISLQAPLLTIDLTVSCTTLADDLITHTIESLRRSTKAEHKIYYQNLLAECENDRYYDTSFSNDNDTQFHGANHYVLKINGTLEYLLGNHQLIQYKMIQQMLLAGQKVHLLGIRRHSIEFEDESIYSVPDFSSTSTVDGGGGKNSNAAHRQRSQSIISLGTLSSALSIASRRRPAQTYSSWTIDRKLVIRIHAADRFFLNDPTVGRVAVIAGIFHGGEILCSHHMTTAKLPGNSDPCNVITWEEDMVFNLKVSDLPRMARLCFAIVGFPAIGSYYGFGSSSKKSIREAAKRPSLQLCWANINFFDYKGILRENSTTLSLWPHSAASDLEQDTETRTISSTSSPGDGGSGSGGGGGGGGVGLNADAEVQKFINPLGTVVQNPDTGCTRLTITFSKYSDGEHSQIRYPDIDEIMRTYTNSIQQAATTTASNLSLSLEPCPEELANTKTGGGVGSDCGENNENSADTTSLTSPTPTNIPRTLSNASTHSNHSNTGTSRWGRKQSLQLDQSSIAGIGNSSSLHTTTTSSSSSTTSSSSPKHFLEQIKEFCDRDLLYRMSDQECELLWFLREDCCRSLPNALNKLLLSFKWNNQKTIGQTLSLLQSWEKLRPDKALELLDYAYPDWFVRKYAINCLRDITNEQLMNFLLQLVQALKYESYIYNDLVQFLLERAFENQRLGHHLFWLLRSEMNDPSVSVSFGLILEAYCRGAVDHIHILSRQMDALNKLKRLNKIIREDKLKETRERKIAQMQDMLAQKFYQETLSHVINPLNPVYKLGAIRVRKCKFMDSKMKPLWLVWQNADRGANDLYLIYKDGDDLRQDMLTLQMIRIMDQLWKDEGLDYRMTPYRCISIAHQVGLIEVVLNADTIANIQKEKGNAALAAFKKGSLLNWIKEHNPTEEALKKAIKEFTLSCAGYCVATYILGIADRHNDNIMVKRNGQLFHIDFGHILGKFKAKFGIRRERVPFVLTHDFVYVITHGKTGKRADGEEDPFETFRMLCEKAFAIIRRKGNFIISLFAMMLSCGIPEVSSVEDLQYLRDTLVLDLPEEAALEHFREKFNDALRNSWKTSFNWCAHSLAKDNRMNE